MAALECACGFLSMSRSNLCKYVSCLPGTKGLNRLALVQSRFCSKTDVIHTEAPRKKRDRFTVLRALASTVDYVSGRPDYRFIEDPVLDPGLVHTKRQKDYLRAMDSGRETAEFVIQQYPHLFPLREPVPAWPKKTMESEEVSIENLALLMKSGSNVTMTVDCYNKLRSGDDIIPLDVHNDMLDFLSFHGPPADGVDSESEHAEKEVEDINAEEAENKSELAVSKWREGNFAEKLFKSLKENASANARTYEVYVLGLLKHGEVQKAYDTYQEMNEKDLHGSLHLYNTLISHVCEYIQGVKESEKEEWELALDIVGAIQRSCIKPDAVTFCALMSVALETKRFHLCEQLMKEMKSLRISPSLAAYYFQLQAANRQGRAVATLVLKEALDDLRNGVVELNLKHPSDLLFFSTATNSCEYTKQSGIAKDLFHFVTDNGLTHLLGKNHRLFYSHCISAYTYGGEMDVDEVFEEYRKIVPKLLPNPPAWMFYDLLFHMWQRKNPTHIPALYSDIKGTALFIETMAVLLLTTLQHNVPEERCEEFLFVAEDAERYMESETAVSLSVIIQMLCLCGRYKEAVEKMEKYQALDVIPSVHALLSVFKLAIKDGNKEGAFSLLRTMANNNLKLTHTFEEIIKDNAFLNEERETINSWF